MRKKEAIGLLPNMQDFCDTVERYLEFLKYPQVIENVVVFTEQNYKKVAVSTVRQYMGTLLNYGLSIEVEDYVYQRSELANKWLLTKEPIALFEILNQRIAFLGEILFELQEGVKTRETIQEIALKKYGYEFHSSDLTRRFQVLRNIGLVYMDRHKKYHISEKGIKELQNLHVDLQKNTVQNIRNITSINDKENYHATMDILQDKPLNCNNNLQKGDINKEVKTQARKAVIDTGNLQLSKESIALSHIYYEKIYIFLIATLEFCKKNMQGYCEVFTSRLPVFINDKKYDSYGDLMISGNKSAIQKKGFVSAPDIVIDIDDSLDNEKMYYRKSIKLSHDGVKEYWVIDLQYKDIMVFNLENQIMRRYTFCDIVKSRIIEEIRVDFSELD